MSYYEPQTAKKVFLYRNGTVKADAKMLVVNDRQVRDFSSFLNRVTSGIRAPVAVRNIYTPHQGHKVHSLEELVSGKYYVAGGSEQFKKLKYGSGPKLLPRRQQRVEAAAPTLQTHHVIVAESRYRRPIEKPFVIHVFRNGDELFHGVRVLLPRRVMASWDHVLEIVTEKADLYTPAKKLCTLDGEMVTQLQDGGKYVAVEGGKAFRRVAYCATNITAARRRRNVAMTLPVVTRRFQKGGRPHPSLLPPPISLSKTVPPPRPQPPPVDPSAILLIPPRRKVRPMAGRRNKEARERALLENRDDSVFGGSPMMERHPRMPSPPPSANLLHSLPRRAAGEEGGRGNIGFRGNNNDLMHYKRALGGGAEDINEGGVAIDSGGGGELETSVEPEVSVSVQDGELTLYPPPPSPPVLTEDSLVEHTADGQAENSSTDLGGTKIFNHGGQNEVSNQGGQNEVSNEGAQNKTPPEGVQINIDAPPEGVQNGAPPEGTENGAPLEVPTEIPNDRGKVPDSTLGDVATSSGGRESNGGQHRDEQQEKEDDEIGGLEGKNGEGEEGGINKNTVGEGEVEEEDGEKLEIKSQLEESHSLPEKEEASKVEPEEVPEEEGVAERSEVKEETDEPEMKLQEREVELVSAAPQTAIDLTMSRKNQEPLITYNEGGSENLPLQQTPTVNAGDTTRQNETESRGERGEGVREEEGVGDGEGVIPPTQATPPPPTEDEHVLIVEDSPQ